jgi:putative hydrolase of the HAD superfamily
MRSTPMPSVKAADLDAVTLDGFGTLVELEAPVERLRTALADHGIEAGADEIGSAFAVEAEYYMAHQVEARDEEALARLQLECSAVFLRALPAELEPAKFAPTFVEALLFRPLEGVTESLRVLQGAGLVLACVSDWDVGVGRQLDRAGLGSFLDVVVSSAEIGAKKPDPRVFRAALERLGIVPERALHIGDGEGDRVGALAAGLAFEPAPVATLPQRLGL